MKIIFMGTGDFGVDAFESLISSQHEIVAAYTAPPKIRGRRAKESKTEIHKIADFHSIPVHCPKTLRSAENQQIFSDHFADIVVVAAYGLILPKEILESKKFGCINLHPSILPRFRGAAPIERMILAGDLETAMCIMQMDEGLDTGDILMQRNIDVPENSTSTQMHEILSKIGAEMTLEVISQIENNLTKPIKQTEEGLIYANKLTKEEARVDWYDSAIQIDRKVRGLNPWPGHYFIFNDEKIKMHEAFVENIEHNFTPGQVVSSNGELKIACKEGMLLITRLQKPGKKIINIADFLRGNIIPEGEIL